jgi:hypothetical protein
MPSRQSPAGSGIRDAPIALPEPTKVAFGRGFDVMKKNLTEIHKTQRLIRYLN